MGGSPRANELEVAASIVSGLTDGALLLDRELRCLTYNLALVEILGVRPRILKKALVAGKSPFESFGNREAESSAAECLRERRVIRLHEVDFETLSGEVKTAIVTFLPVLQPDSEEAVGVIYTVRDVSAEARMQRRFKELLAQEKARADELEERVAERTRELEQALQEVTRLARTDPLTGALNRRAFTMFAEQALGLAERHGRSIGLLMCDLDNFKSVNDTYGHQAGDVVLSEAVAALSRALRRTDKVGRFGGEEFVVLLAETERERVVEIGERCREAVRGIPFAQLVEGGVGRQTISVGCAFYPDHGMTLDDLLTAADQALYYAKERGRDRVEPYSRQLAFTSPGEVSKEACRVLLVDPEVARAEKYRHELARLYQVLIETSFDRAREIARQETLDVIIAREMSDSASGIELLRDTLTQHPNAVRVLITETEDFSVAVKGTNEARVDHVLVEGEGAGRLIKATEESLERRQILRKRFLSEGPGSIRPGPRTESQDLDELLEDEAVSFVYQPIISTRDGAIEGYEALCRPQTEYFKSPRALIDAAVAAGKIWEVSRLIRRKIARELRDLPEASSIFINLHPAVLDDPEFLEGDPSLLPWAERVVFEVTERHGIPDFERCRESIMRLRACKYRIAVDDLGSGYASLNSVALLEPDYVKIDLVLVREIDAFAHKAQLFRRIVDFANDAGIRVVAEGVERKEEAEAVADLGCHLMQGYYFASPQTGFRRPKRDSASG